jgi:hypothetical protein
MTGGYLIGDVRQQTTGTTPTIAVGTATYGTATLPATGDSYAILCMGSASVSSVTDTHGNVWTKAKSGFGSNYFYDMWVCLAPTLLTSGNTVVLHLSSGNPVNAILVGCANVTAVNLKEYVGSTFTSVMSYNSATLATSSEAVFFMMTYVQATAGSPAYKPNTPNDIITSTINMYSLSWIENVSSNAAINFKATTVTSGQNDGDAIALSFETNNNTALAISTSSLPGATDGVAYSQSLAASGGVPPYTWSIISGALPSWATMNSVGVISGTPLGTVTGSFKAQVRDSAGTQVSAALSIASSGNPDITVPSVPTFVTGDTSIPSLQQLAYATRFLVGDIRPMFHAFKTATATISSSNTWTTLSMGAVAYDSESEVSGGSGILTDGIGATIRTQGLYSFTSCATFVATSTAFYVDSSFLITAGASNPNLGSGSTLRFGLDGNTTLATAATQVSICNQDISPICLYPGDTVRLQVRAQASGVVVQTNLSPVPAYNQGRFVTNFSGSWVRSST